MPPWCPQIAQKATDGMCARELPQQASLAIAVSWPSPAESGCHGVVATADDNGLALPRTDLRTGKTGASVSHPYDA